MQASPHRMEQQLESWSEAGTASSRRDPILGARNPTMATYAASLCFPRGPPTSKVPRAPSGLKWALLESESGQKPMMETANVVDII